MKKKQRAFNTHLNICFILFPLFIYLCIVCFIEKSTVPGIIFAVLCLLPVTVFLTSPLFFVFDDESVEIVYNFGLRENIKWSEVRGVTLTGSWLKGGGYPHYEIAYPKVQKQKFFMLGEISKTARTKKLMAFYYKKGIK